MSADDSVQFDDDYEKERFATPEEVIEAMTVAWQNELCAPCLLPTEMDLVTTLLDQISGMEESIARQRDRMQLRISLHRMELQRISFITSDYVRCRLQKIEKNPHAVMEEHNKRKEEGKTAELLAESEIRFAEEYAQAEADLFHKTVLEFMPAALKKISVPRADHQDDMVYAKVLTDNVGNVAIPDWQDLNSEVILEMEKSSCHLIPWESVRPYVENGSMQLM